jgi:hypothetical protein
MKIAYTILVLTIATLVVALADTDHGSQQAFSDSIRAASHMAKR